MIEHVSNSYKLESDSLGYSLTRWADGKSAYFQGDDAVIWRRELAGLLRRCGDDAGRFSRACDLVCSDYDDVLSRE
jgi:hypothetical protein